jgi:hypothetical protein
VNYPSRLGCHTCVGLTLHRRRRSQSLVSKMWGAHLYDGPKKKGERQPQFCN